MTLTLVAEIKAIPRRATAAFKADNRLHQQAVARARARKRKQR